MPCLVKCPVGYYLMEGKGMLEIISEILRGTIVVGLVTAGILAILIWVKNLTTKISFLRIYI